MDILEKNLAFLLRLKLCTGALAALCDNMLYNLALIPSFYDTSFLIYFIQFVMHCSWFVLKLAHYTYK